jgi:hypothetical protein
MTNQVPLASVPTDSHEVFIPFSATTIGVHLPWICLIQYVPLPGFLNLLAVYSSNRFGVLFHTPYTHGIHPSEFSPREQHLLLIEFDYHKKWNYASIANRIHARTCIDTLGSNTMLLRPKTKTQEAGNQYRTNTRSSQSNTKLKKASSIHERRPEPFRYRQWLVNCRVYEYTQKFPELRWYLVIPLAPNIYINIQWCSCTTLETNIRDDTSGTRFTTRL